MISTGKLFLFVSFVSACARYDFKVNIEFEKNEGDSLSIENVLVSMAKMTGMVTILRGGSAKKSITAFVQPN